MHTDKVGDKVLIQGKVVRQESTPKDTPIGRVYTHYHLIQDDLGRIFQYQGASFFPLNQRVVFLATVKAYKKVNTPIAFITIVKAPKAIEGGSS